MAGNGDSAALNAASDDAIFDAAGDGKMRTTVTIDDELVARAQEITGIEEKSALLTEALKRMIQREAAMRLARLGGSDPDAKAPPRRRWSEDGASFENE
jgi:Arc/MetJ family transcription regulator